MPRISEGQYALGALTIFALWLFVGLPWLIYPLEQIKYVVVAADPTPHSNAEPKGTPQAPFFIQVMPGEKSAQSRAEEAEDRQEKRESDRALVAWTKVLAYATCGLILATVVLGFFGYRQMKDVQREFNSTHRPRIRIKHLWLVSDFNSDEAELAFKISFVNSGTGVAFLREIGLRVYIATDIDGLPQRPDFDAIWPLNLFPLGNGITFETDGVTDGRILDEAERDDIRTGHETLMCAGFVEYADHSGIRKTAFCYRLNLAFGEPGRFLPVDDPDYSYQD